MEDFMKRFRVATASCLIITLFLFSSFAWAETDQADPRTMTFAPIEFQPPKAERISLSNGIILYLMEDHELPLIQVQAMIRTGSIYEPADKIGLAGITGSVMRSGGTRKNPSDKLDEMLDQVAARMSVWIGRDAGGASLNTLTKDFDFALDLFAETLMSPAFEEEKVSIAKNRALEGIRRRNDRPSGIASREFYKQVYGADNPYGRESTVETVTAITRRDLVSFHQKYFAPNNMMLGITGDFKKEEIVAKIEKVFSGWEKQKIDFPKVQKVTPREKGGIYKVNRPIPQTQVRMGHLGIKQDNPDFFALSIMNDILGSGGLTSRLFQDIRTRQGLAYSVGSVFRPGKLERGIFLAYGATRAEKTLQAMTAMIEHIQKIQKDLVSDEELSRAKGAFLNSFIFSFSSPSQIVSRQISLEYYGLPEDFLEQYRKNVEKVTKGDILIAARKYLHPDQIIIVTVGDGTLFDKPLSSLGEVKEIILSP